MKILAYNNKVVYFYCKKCNLYGEHDLNLVLTDNCVERIKIMCDRCKSYTEIVILICNDPSLAVSLHEQYLDLIHT